MRFLATHDADGNIRALVVGPSDGPPVATPVEAGQCQSEVDVPSDIAKLFRGETLDEKRIIKALAVYRVATKGKAKLVRG
jgi:hypothetical protein